MMQSATPAAEVTGRVLPRIAGIDVAEGSLRKTTMLINHSMGITQGERAFPHAED